MNDKISPVMNNVLKGTSPERHCTKNRALSTMAMRRFAPVCSVEEFILEQENNKTTQKT